MHTSYIYSEVSPKRLNLNPLYSNIHATTIVCRKKNFSQQESASNNLFSQIRLLMLTNSLFKIYLPQSLWTRRLLLIVYFISVNVDCSAIRIFFFLLSFFISYLFWWIFYKLNLNNFIGCRICCAQTRQHLEPNSLLPQYRRIQNRNRTFIRTWAIIIYWQVLRKRQFYNVGLLPAKKNIYIEIRVYCEATIRYQ